MQLAILSLPRTGSSLLAGMLHDNGVSMGNDFKEADEHNPSGYYEDRELVRLLQSRNPELLRNYIERRSREEDVWGMKEAELCIQLAEVEDAFTDLKVINLTRPLLDSMRSLEKIYGRPSSRIAKLSRQKKQTLKQIEAPVLDVEFYELVSEPELTYQKICDFLEIEPNWPVIERINPDHVHHCDTI